MNQRMQLLKSAMQQDKVEALIISRGSDIKYLTGFTGEYGVAVLLLTADKDYFITDGRFTNQAEQETEGLEVSAFARGSSYFARTGELVKQCGIKECGIYGEDISFADYQALTKECTGTHFVQAAPYVENLRRIKTSEEIATIRKACRISERSFYALLDVIKPGVTEIDIANELEYQFRSCGGSGFCFETIVASGPDNGANCHATPSMRKIQQGDLVTIDFGTRYQDYCSDITRTVAVGEIKNQELLNIYRIVRDSKREAEKVLAPGLAMSQLHKVINQYVEERGYKIPHGPGHSFGLDIHEAPFISAANDYQLQPGVIHTIEPGIYVPGVGGVRIEDDYLITENGFERLTNITDELIIL